MHVPQPSLERLTPFKGNPIVVGTVPSQDPLVALTAASLAETTGAELFFAYVDPTRYVEREFADGTVDHRAINPDAVGDEWQELEKQFQIDIGDVLVEQNVSWTFRYLAGRVDRALTHLARAVDAALIILGAQHAGLGARMQDFFEGSAVLRLTQHQHRPVLVVPLRVTDWQDEPEWK